MPREVSSKEKLIDISSRASECIVIKDAEKGYAKIKLRTPRYLYTMKVPLSELDDLLKMLKVQNIRTIE